MGWSSLLVPALVLALILYVPGILVNALLFRSRVLTIAFAPLTGAAVLGAASLVSGFKPGVWGLGLVVAVTLVTMLLVAGLSFLGGRRPHDWIASFTHLFSLSNLRGLLGTLLCLGINAGVVLFIFLRSFRSADAILYSYDTPFHMAVIRWILDSGDASSLHSATVDGTIGSHFYPALWHGWVSLALCVLNTTMMQAINASTLVVLLFVWPLSASLLTFAVFSKKFDLAPQLAIAIAGLFGSYPWGFLTFGVLYSNFFAYSLTPAYLAAIVLLVRGLRLKTLAPGELIAYLLLLVGGFAAIALAQPNSVFTIAVMIFPFLFFSAWKVCAKRSVWLALGVCSSLLIAAAGIWIALYKAPFMRRTVTWVWDSFQTPAESLRAVATLSMNATDGEYGGEIVLAVFVLLGLLVALLRKKAWIVFSYLAVASLYVLCAAFEGRFRNVATGFWYHDSFRPAGAMCILAVALAAYALSSCVTAVSKLVENSASTSVRRGVVAGTSIVLIAAVVVLTLASSNIAYREKMLAQMSADVATKYTDTEELAFMEKARSIVGTDSKVMNDPFDGSMFAYGVEGLPVVFPAMPGNWIGSPNPESEYLKDHLDAVETDSAKVCPMLRDLDVHYVMVLERHKQIFDEPHPWLGVRNITPQTPGFEPVLQQGPYSLYKITACGLG